MDIIKIIKVISDKYGVILSDNSIKELEGIIEQKEYRKEEQIFAQGQISHCVYIIGKGIIRQYYFKDGRDITEHFSCEGDVATCLESLFLKEPSKLNMEAIESSVLYLLDYEKMKVLSNCHSDINVLLQAMLEYKLIVSQRKADSWRFESSQERYLRFCREYPMVAKRASIAHIASYLLMAPETLSRVRSGVL